MLVKNDKGFYTLSGFSNFKNLTHGFSTVEFGNMKSSSISRKAEVEGNRNNFFKALGLTNPAFVTAQQVHGNKIAIVDGKDAGKEIKGVDGLVTKEGSLFLLVFVADCLPILAFDPVQKVIGIAHAGWRGTLGKIAGNLIKTFVKFYSNPKDIQLGFGPVIEFCHYEVGSDVAVAFKKATLGKSILKSISDKIYLDLKQANIEQLTSVGVPKENIDASVKKLYL